MSNEINYETLQTMNEMRRSEIKRLERVLAETKMQSEAEVDNLRKKLLINESESQRTLMEYQHQCGNYFRIIKKLINSIFIFLITKIIHLM